MSSCALFSQFRINKDVRAKRQRRLPTKRTKAGCFCCRKRKIKCLGEPPCCRNCRRSNYECVWPNGVESLPHNSEFKLVKIRKQPIRFVEVNCTRVKDGKVEEEEEEISRTSDLSTKLITVSNHIHTDVSKSRIGNEIIEDRLFRRYLEEVSDQAGPFYIPNGFNTWIPGVDMSRENAYYYSAFVKGFMVSVSPQMARQELQPPTVFIPPGAQSRLLRHVFYACGAAFLCWKQESMVPLAEAKYEECLEMLDWFVGHESIVGNEQWLVVTLLCLCLREKYQGEDLSRQTYHLAAALEMIRLWQERKHRRAGPLSFLSPKQTFTTVPDHPLLDTKLNGSDGLHDKNAVVFHKLLVKLRRQFSALSGASEAGDTAGLDSVSNVDSISKIDTHVSNIDSPIPHSYPPQLLFNTLIPLHNPSIDTSERTLLESFLYNYTVNLFVCDSAAVDFLPSPFNVYKAFEEYLAPPIFDCAVPWMNNPVMGAAIPAFEIAAKANWLALQLPLSAANCKIAGQLLKSAQFYTHPVLPPEVKASEPENVQRRLLESCYLGDMVAKAAYVFLRKMLDPQLKADNPEIVAVVEKYIADLSHLTLHSPVSCICSWPTAIMAAAAVKQEHRDYLWWRTINFREVVRAEAMVRILEFMKVIWEDGDGVGLDAVILQEYKGHLRF